MTSRFRNGVVIIPMPKEAGHSAGCLQPRQRQARYTTAKQEHYNNTHTHANKHNNDSARRHAIPLPGKQTFTSRPKNHRRCRWPQVIRKVRLHKLTNSAATSPNLPIPDITHIPRMCTYLPASKSLNGSIYTDLYKSGTITSHLHAETVPGHTSRSQAANCSNPLHRQTGRAEKQHRR